MVRTATACMMHDVSWILRHKEDEQVAPKRVVQEEANGPHDKSSYDVHMPEY
jgi:hypothetical protein